MPPLKKKKKKAKSACIQLSWVLDLMLRELKIPINMFKRYSLNFD